ncbi:MAG: radical SAM protein [Planctomycetota bacterium]
MKILLIKPYWLYPGTVKESTYNRIWPPLCLANCAALLEKEGHQVKILDAHAERIKPIDITGYINGYDKIFITSSTIDRWQCPNLDLTAFFETVSGIKKRTDEFYVMGYHGTVKPEEILKLTGAKAVIRGEPELTVLELGRKKDLSRIDGIAYKNINGQIISNKDREPLNLDALPVPAWHLLNVGKYFYEVLGNNFLLLEGSRGCHYHCSFCSKIMYGPGVRQKSVSKIISEIDDGVTRCRARTGMFIDLDFTYNKEWVFEFCNRLKSKNYHFKWSCQTRLDKVDALLLKKMKQVGCDLILYGIETGSPQIMKSLNKGLSLPQVAEGIRLTKEAGIKTIGIFMFGLPGETDTDRKVTVDFARRLNPDYVSFHITTPYPGSKLFDGNNNNKILPETIAGYDFFILKRTLRRAYFSFYCRPAYILKKLFSEPFLTCRYGLRLFLNYFK